LPKEKWRCELVEQSLFSADEDLGCKHLWPSAAVLGVGSTAGGGVQPLFLFDEHVPGQSKVAESCSQIVTNTMIKVVPAPLTRLLREVNVIDEYGGGHPQNLNNLIKTMHEIRLLVGQSDDGTQLKDVLSPTWKKAVIDACLVAILYCLENGIDLIEDPETKRKALNSSLENYLRRSPHANDPRFAEAAHRMRGIFNDQKKVFQQAVLQGSKGPIRDATGKVIPQLLIIGRVCFACEQCWGPAIRDVIATHFWEGELQNHLNFYAVEDAVRTVVSGQKIRVSTHVGTMTHNVLRDIEIVAPEFRNGPPRRRRAKVWVFTMTPSAGVTRVHQAIQNYLTDNNYGCGFVLIKNRP
jgi:hypothetical protein